MRPLTTRRDGTTMSNHWSKRVVWPGGSRLLGALLAGALLALAGASTANAASAWRIVSKANTNVAPGASHTYLVSMQNVGDADVSGTVRLDVTLPPGVTGVSVSSVDLTVVWSCPGMVGASSFSCTTTPLPLSTFPPPSIVPIVQRLLVTANVDGSASGVLTAVFVISGGGAARGAGTVDPTSVSPAPAAFGVDAFDGSSDADALGTPATQAGDHPYAVKTAFDFTTYSSPAIDPPNDLNWPVEPPKDTLVDAPPGLVGNPTAASECTLEQLAPRPPTVGTLCPADSQVGVVRPTFNGGFVGGGPVPLYNMVPPPKAPARFGFQVSRTVIVLDASLRSGGDYGLTIGSRNLSEGLAITGTEIALWGVPADASHDAERFCPGVSRPGCTTEAPLKPLLRNPTACTAPGVGLVTTLHTDSWLHPGAFGADGQPDLSDPNWKSASFVSHNPPGYPFAPGPDWGTAQGPTGCENVPFAPTFRATPATPARAASPTGFSFDLTLPQTDDPDLIATSDLRKTVVTFPEGLRVSPSSADGLAGCSAAQIALDSIADPTCPDGAKIGKLRIDTPLLDEPLEGAVYLATPFDNKFGSLLALYLVARGPGVIVKLPGRVEADPNTGQLTTTFDDNPQLPFERLHLELTGGSRAPLVTPSECGTYTTHAVMTSWSGKTVASDSSFTLAEAADGRPCAPLGFSPHLAAGTINPAAGVSSPFVLMLRRGDRDREIGSLSVDMPQGLLGRIADVELCDATLAQGADCPASSRIGGVTVGAGAGASPFYISDGSAYITGPYKGAPFGLAIVVHAKAGPFDLGVVRVMNALFVDKHDATLRVVTDPLPTILQGIPLQVRDIRVAIDREGFMLNPTSCAEQRIGATVRSTAGDVANVGSRFQVGGCVSLPLTPRMDLRVGGQRRYTRRGASTPFTASLRQTPGQSNLRSVSVSLPTTINARLEVVDRACTREAYEAGDCERARAGSALAMTPLLRDPLRGSVYFVKNGRPLPDLFVRLRGQVDFDLIGRVSIPGGKRLATTFDAIPDVPVSLFRLSLVAGRQGPVGTAANLCTRRGRRAAAQIVFQGQNGLTVKRSQRLRIGGCRSAGGGAKRGDRQRGRARR